MKKGNNRFRWPEDWSSVRASELCEENPIDYVQKYEGGYYIDYAPGAADFEIAPGTELTFNAIEDFEELKRPASHMREKPEGKSEEPMEISPTVSTDGDVPTVGLKPARASKNRVKYK